jgi:hypothetical protein
VDEGFFGSLVDDIQVVEIKQVNGIPLAGKAGDLKGIGSKPI